MTLAVVFAAFVLVSLARGLEPGDPVPWWTTLAVAWGWPALGGAWLLGVSGLMAARLDRRGDRRAPGRLSAATAAYQLVAIGVHAAAVLWGGWAAWVRGWMGDPVFLDELVTTAPLMVVLTVAFAAGYPLERRIREAALLGRLDRGEPVHAVPSLWRYLWRAWRHRVLFFAVPLALIAAWSEGVGVVAAWRGWGEWARGGAQLAGTLGVFALSPVLLRVVWDTVKLREGPLHDRVTALARAHRVALAGVLVWRTEGMVVNAAVSGIIPGLRYVVLSDALLERLSEAQVDAVALHELAHVRKRHMLWLGLAVLATVTVAGTPLGWAATLIAWGGADPWAVELTAAGLTLAATMFVLGAVSRRFEWQADAFAARHVSALDTAGATDTVSDAGIGAMAGALGRVAALNGVAPSRFAWRHGSIAERQRRLRSLAGLASDRLPIDRAVSWCKAGVVAGCVLGAALVGVDAWLAGVVAAWAGTGG